MAYSQDLRERVVRAVQRGDRTQRAIAADFGVSLSFVEEVWRRQREMGNCAVKVWRHGRKAKLRDRSEQLRAEVAAHPDVLLTQLCERVRTPEGSKVSVSVMSRTLRRLKITRKKSHSTPASRRRNG
jgi:transposase